MVCCCLTAGLSILYLYPFYQRPSSNHQGPQKFNLTSCFPCGIIMVTEAPNLAGSATLGERMMARDSDNVYLKTILPVSYHKQISKFENLRSKLVPHTVPGICVCL